MAELRKHFYVTTCKLEDNPKAKIDKQVEKQGLMPVGKCVVVDDNNCEQTAGLIRLMGRYAIGLGDTSGSLALAEGFMSVQYLILHKLRSPIVFKVKEGPKLITKEQVKNTPHKMKDSEIFILFQIDEEQPELASKISQHALTHPPKGYTVRQSYVTDINSMISLEL